MSFPIAGLFVAWASADARYGVYLDDECICSGFGSRADARSWADRNGHDRAKVRRQ